MALQGYFNEIRARRLITGSNLGIFVRLNELSALAFAKPRACGAGEEIFGGGGGVPALEAHQKFVVARLALLNRVRDADEMRFLDYWARWDKNILEAIDSGRLPYRYTKDTLNSALGDIERGQKCA